MSSPTAPFERMLASSVRVLRSLTSAEDLIAAWPSLRQKSLLSPLTLTDIERRLFLDLPDEDMETSNLRAVTGLSREQLIEKANSDPKSLTDEEVVLLKDRFWLPRTRKEKSTVLHAMGQTSQEGLEEYYEGRRPAYAPNEEAAFGIGATEFWGRKQAVEDEKRAVAANAALPYAKEWIQYLYQQKNSHWGFVCLYEAAAQQLEPARREYFNSRMDAFFQHALAYNGSADIIARQWMLLHFNAPQTAFAPTSPLVGDAATNAETDYQNGAILRKAFQDILKDPEEYQKAEHVTSSNTPTQHFEDGIAGAGFLTNTFLVIDPGCIDSVLTDAVNPWYDNMRILAFEADFPVQGREYAEGYQGFTWVRLDQLVYNFYELRLLKADEVGMDKIWRAAQESRHGAFVSMDPGEASMTTSNGMQGFTRDSVLGRDWYAVKDAKQE